MNIPGETVFVGRDGATILWIIGESRADVSTALDLLVDMVCNPLFDANELEKERSVILEELAMSNDHPDARARSEERRVAKACRSRWSPSL